MLRYILKRLLQGVFVLIGVSIVIFCLSRIIPGDPARLALGQHATQEAVDNLSKQMYLDKPLPVQYILWFRDVLHGDFGISLSTRRSVTEDMKQLLPATFELIFWSALFMVGGSLILGRAAARHRDGILDSIIRVFSYIGIAVPSFVVAIVLLVIFGNLWQVIPTLGRLSTGVAPPDTITGFYVLDALVQGQFSTAWDAFLHLLLPAFALSLGGMFQDARLMRSALTDNMGKEYMCVSRSYGLPEKSPDESISVQALQHVSDHSYGHGHCIYGGQRIHGGTGIQLAGIFQIRGKRDDYQGLELCLCSGACNRSDVLGGQSDRGRDQCYGGPEDPTGR